MSHYSHSRMNQIELKASKEYPSCKHYLELLEGEPTASAQLGVVLHGLAVDDGPEGASCGAGEGSRSLGLAG
jgi:hypothetical protein